MANGFVDPKVGTLKVKVAVNSDTNIAQTSDVVTGNTYVDITGFSMDANLAGAQTVFNKILGDIAGATFDTDTTLRIYTVTVDEKQSPALRLSESDVDIAAGSSANVTVTRNGTGAISVTPQSALEGVTYTVDGTTITFTNATATEGEGTYIVTCAETNDYSAGMAFVTINGTDA